MKINMGKSLALGLSAILAVSGCSDFTGSPVVQAVPHHDQSPRPEKGSVALPADFLNPNEGEFSERKMLINIGTQVLAKQAESFANQVPALKESIEQYCGDLRSKIPAEASRSQAQGDWKRVMLAFHNLEGAPFGPFVNRGRFVVDYLYAFPYLNTCGIDQNVLAFTKGAVDLQSLLYNVRGLGAIEYLLFEDSLRSKCNMRANPDLKVWNELPGNVKQQQRCEWALQLMSDVQDKASLLRNDWAVQQGNFTLQMLDKSTYANEKVAINALTDSLSHIEFLKDIKLGRPLGRHKECAEEKCPADVEHRYSGLSLASVESHLKSFRAVFLGSVDPERKGFGFDDLLVKSGRQDVLERMIAALNKALDSVKVAQNSGSLQEQIESYNSEQCKLSTTDNRMVEICAVHADIRQVASILKTEVIVALSLRAPPSHQGDND